MSDCQKTIKKRQEAEERAGEAVKTISRLMESHSYKDSIEDFILLISTEHRTLQQAFTSLCLAWLQHLAELQENRYDLRNQASVEIAKALKNAFNEKYKNTSPNEWQYINTLPLI